MKSEISLSLGRGRSGYEISAALSPTLVQSTARLAALAKKKNHTHTHTHTKCSVT